MTSTPKLTLLQLFLSLDTSFAKRGICWRGTSKGTLNGNLVKNLRTPWGKLRKKTGRSMRIFWPHRKADESHQRIMLLVKNLLTQWGRLRRKTKKGNQSMKNLQNLMSKCNNVTLGAESSRSGSYVTTTNHSFNSSGLTSINPRVLLIYATE